ncbi:hypothetical protein BS333_03095 [Vibrio azureus]|uniref:PilW family protein n=1 Tax=Vibrio azureus TaxID=512649 RepID=UPI0003A544BA|nr:hypothetical protein [Vibrio azureus]AUI85446.1 hypothetical protein BS333_03095 [Vibrio azureus]
MPIANTTAKALKGASLIEFMIAALLGGLALSAISALYISANKSALMRAKDLMLLQNTASVMQAFKNDLQRGGFNGELGHSVTLSGANHSIYTLIDEQRILVAYAYYDEMSGNEPIYRNVVYERRAEQPESLFICQKDMNRVWHIEEVTQLSGSRSCFQAFDSSQIELDKFTVSTQLLRGEQASSLLVNITLSTHLAGFEDKHTSQSFTIKQRNWQ